ncbi:hypothetical protein O9X99_01965 [Agrobacterium salinitolerans]|uniref:Minor tail protein n=1 Tax=Agrobacterium salinitolerans TaxID=1183413 RepID=A0ABY3BVL3_9HYPH|nr:MULTISPECIES: hypothetical protein [Agrobacterium]MCZ7890433.1 hypothetical protein [Agrobacterium salinitolerans]TRA96845.1 hypothetical protein EXN23_00990 [Agrobacterium salinitolerans]
MVALPYPSPRKSSGGGFAGPTFIRPVPRRLLIDQINNRNFLETITSTALTKPDLVGFAHAVEPGLPVSALGWERFLIGPGGAGFSGRGYGGLPGGTARDIVPFDAIPEDAVIQIEIGAPGVGQVGGQGTYAGYSSVTFGDNYLRVEGGMPGEGSQENQRALHLWAMQAGITISDLGQNIWPNQQPVGPSSFAGPGAGAPNDFADVIGTVYGGYGSRNPDDMYKCGDGGNAGYAGGDYPGGDAVAGPGGGGSAGDAAYPGGAGSYSAFRQAIIVLEAINV